MPEQTLIQKAQCAAINQVPDDGPAVDLDVLDRAVSAALRVVVEDLLGSQLCMTHDYTGLPMEYVAKWQLERLLGELR